MLLSLCIQRHGWKRARSFKLVLQNVVSFDNIHCVVVVHILMNHLNKQYLLFAIDWLMFLRCHFMHVFQNFENRSFHNNLAQRFAITIVVCYSCNSSFANYAIIKFIIFYVHPTKVFVSFKFVLNLLRHYLNKILHNDLRFDSIYIKQIANIVIFLGNMWLLHRRA